MAGRAHRRHVRVEQTGLAEPPRRGETDCHTVGSGTLQQVELRATIDKPRRLDRALVVERVHRTSLYGITGHWGR